MPKPRSGESQKDFFNRAIPMLVKEEGYPQKQAVAIAYSYWQNRHKKKQTESITEDIGGDMAATGQGGIKRYKTHTQLDNKQVEGRYTKKGDIYYQDGKPIGVYLKGSESVIFTEEFLQANPGFEDALKNKLENVGGVGLSAGLAMYAAPAKVLLRKEWPVGVRLKEHVRKLN